MCPRVEGREGRKRNNFPRQAGRQANPSVVTLGGPLKQHLLIYFTRIVNSIGPLADDRAAPGEPRSSTLAISLAGEKKE